MPPQPPRLSRRRLLGGLAGLAGVLAGAGALTDVLPGGSWLRRHLGLFGDNGTIPRNQPGAFRLYQQNSAARSQQVQLTTWTPPQATTPPPVCLVLPGRGDSSMTPMVGLGLPNFVAAAGGRLTLVSVDGGDDYWHRVRPGDDPMAMLLEELPGWLAELKLPPPQLVLGYSMGGFGALLYARERVGRGRPLDAAAVVSPALFADWPEAEARHVFADRADWERTEPLRHLDQLGGTRLGVWCGTADVFLDNARTLAERATTSSFTAGAHTMGYWNRVTPDALRFLTG